MNFDITCHYCEDRHCRLGHQICNRQDCPDYEKYEFDAYDYYDAYLDDKNDGEIPPDYEL